MTIKAGFEHAVKQFRSNHFKEAYSSVRRLLKRHPHDLDSLNLASLCSIQLGKFSETLTFATKMLAVKPGFVLAHYQRGMALYHLMRPEQAYQDFKQATDIQPDFADAFIYLGLISKDLQKLDEAVVYLSKAVELKPDDSSAVNNRALVFRTLGRLDEALRDLSQAIRLDPQNPLNLNNRGAIWAERGDFEQALTDYNKALMLHPDYADAVFNRGYARRKLGRFEEAVADFETHLSLIPDHAKTQNELGLTLIDLNRHEEALAVFDKMISLHPDKADLFNNRGLVHAELCLFDAALSDYNTALSLRPDFAAALSNRGSLKTELHQFDAALADFEQALSLDPEFAEAKWNKALHLLRFEDYERGWRLYEARWQRDKIKPATRQFTKPLWLGEEDLSGNSILLHAEQGLGDTIQFCRFAQQVANLGARVILDVQPPLRDLLAQLDGVELAKTGPAEPADVDYHCPLMSLPLALNTTIDKIPFQDGYLSCSPDEIKGWSDRLSGTTGLKMGIAWSGNPQNENDRSRSMSLQTFLDGMPGGCALFSLQKDIPEQDRDLFEQTPHLQHFGADLKQTAALCMAMDIIVTVDTSIAHLAGALGQPVCLLLAYTPDFRWALNRDDSPWYSSLRLYRQGDDRDWAPVFADLRKDILNQYTSGDDGHET